MSRLRTFVHSLKFRLTLGAVAALAVGMTVAALLLISQTERDTLASQREHQVSETARTAQVLSRRVVDLQRALQATASQLDPQTLADSTRLAQFIKTKPVLNAMFASVFVVSPAGHIVLLQRGETQSFPGSDLADRAYVERTLIEKRPFISEPMVSLYLH